MLKETRQEWVDQLTAFNSPLDPRILGVLYGLDLLLAMEVED